MEPGDRLRENRDRNMDSGFIIGTTIAAISILLSTLGIFWLLRISQVRDNWLFYKLEEIDFFGNICCGLTIAFILLAFAGIMQANYALMKYIKKQ